MVRLDKDPYPRLPMSDREIAVVDMGGAEPYDNPKAASKSKSKA